MFGYKQTLTPQFQQGVIADYKQVRGELAKPENVGRKAVVEMNLRERFAAAVKIAYDKGYISAEIKQQLGSLTAEEIAAAVAFGGALGIAATSAEASAVIGPVGTFAGAVYGGTQLTQLTKVLLLSAKATNREQLEPAAKAFGAWMGSLSKDGVLAIAGAAGGAAVSPTATAAVDAVLTKGVTGAKRAMSGVQSALEQEQLVTNEGIIIRMPKQKTISEKVQAATAKPVQTTEDSVLKMSSGSGGTSTSSTIPNNPKPITAKTLEHIFHGEINKKGNAVGFHSDAGEMQAINQTRATKITKTPDKNGVYVGKVEVQGIAKKAESSFFPDSWSKSDVINAVKEAYANRIADTSKGANYFEGKSSSGVTVGMFLNKDGTIATAFPIHGK